MDPNVITLTPGEVMLARMMAALRTGTNELAGVGSKRFIDDRFESDLIGICGEIVYAKRTNLYLDLSFEPRSGGHDFTNNNGETIDVKTTQHENGRLLVTMSKSEEKRSDYYVLVTGKIPTFTIRGWATADEVFSSVVNLGRGDCYGLMQDQLRPLLKKEEQCG